jgi:hypothetical protein
MKIGPLLRRESDLRIYHNLFRNTPDDIGGIKKAWLQYLATEQEEPAQIGCLEGVDAVGTVMVKFDGWRDYFARLNGWNEWLHQEIRAITRLRWLKEADSIPQVPIAINVRCGDFAVPKTPEELFTRGGVRTPIAWFIASLKAIRKAAGSSATAYVVSDGTDAELEGLLACDDIIRVKSESAISGLLFLARAGVLIGAGGSTFSAWAAFLGQMPTITHPGQSLIWFNLQNRRGLYVGEFDPEKPNQAFLDQAASILGSRTGDLVGRSLAD